MRLEIDIAEHHYNNIMALDSVSLGRVPYKGIIMYSINAIKHGKVLEQEPTKNDPKFCPDRKAKTTHAEGFLHCIENDCVAYKDGKCLKYNSDQGPTTNSEIDMAIKIIKADSLAPYSVNDILSARDLAVEALKQMAITKNDLGVDCIKKSDAINIIQDMHGLARADVISDAVNRIITMPSVTPQEPRKGHWITKIKSDLRGDMWPTNPKCSECGGEPYYSNTIYNYKFCPYCGARMIEPQESEDT